MSRFQKASLYGWAGGSACTIIAESWEILQLNKVKRKDESEEAWQARQAKAIAEINSHSLVLFHGLVQVFPFLSKSVSCTIQAQAAVCLLVECNTYICHATICMSGLPPKYKAVGGLPKPVDDQDLCLTPGTCTIWYI